MDGINGDQRVVVLAATNRPDSLDPALRRPGRFDREIEIGIPKEKDRADILRKQLGPMPHSLTDEQIDDIASVTHGYVGADLLALTREAALLTLDRCLTNERNSSSKEKGDNPSELEGTAEQMAELDQLQASLSVSHEDLRRALALIKPSAIR